MKSVARSAVSPSALHADSLKQRKASTARPGVEMRPVKHPAPIPLADHVWLRMPNMVVHGLLHFDEPVQRHEILDLIARRMCTMERFSQRVISPAHGLPYWEAVSPMRPGAHFQECHLTTNCETQIMRKVQDLLHAPIDMGRPPWDMTLLHRQGKPSMLLLRVHHVMSDGRGLMEALLRCDDDPNKLATARAQAEALHVRHTKSLRQPLGFFARAQRALWLGITGPWRVASACGRLILRPHDTRPTSVKHLEPAQRLVLRKPLSWKLSTLKSVAQGLGGGTVNDVALAAFAGALRTYMKAHGDPVRQVRVNCLQALNLAQSDAGVGNAVSVGICPLPVDCDDAAQRFARVRRHMMGVKGSAEPTITARVGAFMSYLPASVTRWLYARVSDQCSVFLSNVHGPTETVKLAGHRVADMCWFNPCFGNIAIGFPMISYGGRVNIGLTVDPAVIADPDALHAALAAEMESLQRLAEANAASSA